MMDPDKININAFSRKGENRTERLTEPNRRSDTDGITAVTNNNNNNNNNNNTIYLFHEDEI